jgi:hypothetical protein
MLKTAVGVEKRVGRVLAEKLRVRMPHNRLSLRLPLFGHCQSGLFQHPQPLTPPIPKSGEVYARVRAGVNLVNQQG